MSDDRGIKVVLLGESGVGKTNLIRVSMGKPFDKNENSTISSSYYETISLSKIKNIYTVYGIQQAKKSIVL